MNICDKNRRAYTVLVISNLVTVYYSFRKKQKVGETELSEFIVSLKKEFIFSFHIYKSKKRSRYIYIYIYIYISPPPLWLFYLNKIRKLLLFLWLNLGSLKWPVSTHDACSFPLMLVNWETYKIFCIIVIICNCWWKFIFVLFFKRLIWHCFKIQQEPLKCVL